ncbi:nitrogen fixation protein NifR [Staphylococcus haemolyticus]|nr:nitrogen fixation protein NifR [Staphylococcus haemolyticus]
MLQAKQVGVRGPNKENFSKKFYKQCKLGFGAPAKRISLRNSTSNASWGSGPQQREFH